MNLPDLFYVVLFFIVPAPAEMYTLSLHDALPIWPRDVLDRRRRPADPGDLWTEVYGGRGLRASQPELHRSEENTSELQSHSDLVCRLLLEKKKKRANPSGATT